MYGALPAAQRAWRALFEKVFSDTNTSIQFIEHSAPIATLWERDDLCCDFMCGWPFVRSERKVHPIAAPVPSPARYLGLPRYCSEFLVLAASGFDTLEATFGHCIGWMANDSQSGFNAPRAHLARYANFERRSLYAEAKGPLGTPLKTLEALRRGDVDIIALDSYFLDLCRRHEPERLEGVLCVATTEWTPIPLLVAAPGIDGATVTKLREHLGEIHGDPGYAKRLDDVLLERFVAPDVASYRSLEAMAQAAVDSRYTTIR